MTNEEAINVLEDYDINFERHTAEAIAEAHEMAIKAIIKTIPNEGEKIIRISKGTLKARTGRFVVYDVEWLKEHYNTTEMMIYGQPTKRTEEHTEMHECDKKECWIEHRGTFKPHIECPKCGIWFLREDLPRNSYCPNCGSRNHWEWELKLDGGKKE